MRYKTPVVKSEEVVKGWKVVDAEGKILGRLASEVAKVLKGKTKPNYTPHVDHGDFVIVVNAEKVVLTGRKLDNKVYWKHTGYVGGIKKRSAKEILLSKKPEEVVELAVKGMLSRGALSRDLRAHLKVYAGPSHPHAAQKPEVLSF